MSPDLARRGRGDYKKYEGQRTSGGTGADVPQRFPKQLVLGTGKNAEIYEVVECPDCGKDFIRQSLTYHQNKECKGRTKI